MLIGPILGGLIYAKKYKEKRQIEKEIHGPIEDPKPKDKLTPEVFPTKKLEAGDKIDVKSAYEYNGARIFYKVKLENHTKETMGDIKINLFVPAVFMLQEKEKYISMLEPNESKTVTFEIRPTGECGDCNVSGRIEYYNYNTKGHEMLPMVTKMVSVICPVLKRKEINIKQWERVTDELIKTEENIKELSIPAENLFNIAARVIKDNSMFMLKPEITSTPQLFEGCARFYAEGVKGLRYAAYIEVVGGEHKSRLILKAWAEKEEALTGFYHRLLDGIEKRVDVKIYIDDPIMQIHIDHIGDKIGMDKKIVKGGTGVTAGGDVTFSDVTGQVAVGKNITQAQTLSPLDKKELRDCLVQFQKEINKLGLPANTLNTVNGDITVAITEVEKEKPDPSKIKNRFQGAIDTMKDMGDTIEKVSKWTWTEKVIKILGKLGLSILL